MSMTVAVTRNVPGRFRGFLASCMLEVAPGVYVAPHMNGGVRERLWQVILGWAGLVPGDGGVVLFWRDQDAASGLRMRMIGWPKKELFDYEGVWLSLGELRAQHDLHELERLAEPDPPGD